VIIHSTPSNFGPQNSQAIIGIQMASAYTGSTLMPPIFGVIADKINIGLYPFFLLFFVVLMIMMSERLNRTIAAVKRTVIE
jgi:fucose permease